MTDILIVSLTDLKEEADNLLAADPTLSRDEAYGRALGKIAAVQAEGHAVNPFEARVLAELKTMGAAKRPVSATALRVRLGVDSRYTMYNHLSALEGRGLVVRPTPTSKRWALPEYSAGLRAA